MSQTDCYDVNTLVRWPSKLICIWDLCLETTLSIWMLMDFDNKFKTFHKLPPAPTDKIEDFVSE